MKNASILQYLSQKMQFLDQMRWICVKDWTIPTCFPVTFLPSINKIPNYFFSVSKYIFSISGLKISIMKKRNDKSKKLMTYDIQNQLNL